MTFARQAGAAVVLVVLTLSLQCAGMAALIAWIRTSLAHEVHRLGPLRSAALIVRFMTAIIVLHIFEILLWAGFYRWRCFSLSEPAFYFSAASYATVGYGDVVLPHMWRTLGPLESIIGVLMCGLSTSFLFAVVTRLVEREVGSQARSRSPNGTYSRGRRFKHERAQQARKAEFNSRTQGRPNRFRIRARIKPSRRRSR